MDRFDHLRFWHAEASNTSGERRTIDFAAPNRMRVRTTAPASKRQTLYVVGSTSWSVGPDGTHRYVPVTINPPH